jgi:outer membrane protein
MTSTRSLVLPHATGYARLVAATRGRGRAPCALALAAILPLMFSGAARADDMAPATPPAADAPAPQPASPVLSNTLRAGYYFVHYSATANNLSGPFTPAGINLSVNNVNTPYFAYLRRITDHLQLEVAAGVPPTTHTIGRGPAFLGSVPFNGQEVATAKWFSPSVLLDYSFFEERARFRPYVGAGFNYTHFYDRYSTAAGNAANGGPTTTDLTDSFGPAGTAGLSYRFTDRISAIASFSIATVRSNYDSNTSGIDRRTTVDFHPTTWVLAVGYSF